MTSAQGGGPTTGPLLTVAEVLRVSNRTVYRLIRGGALPALPVGKNSRIRESEFEGSLVAGHIEIEEVGG